MTNICGFCEETSKNLGVWGGNPTLCEVNYNCNGEVVTPYRYRGKRSKSAYHQQYREQLRSLTSLSLCYEPTTVGHRSPVPNFTGQHNAGVLSRSTTTFPTHSVHGYHPPNTAILYERVNRDEYQPQQPPHTEQPRRNSHISRGQVTNKSRSVQETGQKGKKKRAKTAPPHAMNVEREDNTPQTYYRDNMRSLSMLPMYATTEDEQEDSNDKLVWVESLNAWVPVKSQENQNSLPYLHFVNSVNLMERGFSQSMEHDGQRAPILPCERFLSHMRMKEELAKARALQKQQKLEEEKRKRLERREAMRAFKDHLKSSFTAPAAPSKQRSQVRFKPQPKVSRPRPVVREAVVESPDSPSSPDSGLDEHTQSKEEESVQPVYLTEPVSDEDENDLDHVLELEKSPTPSPPPTPTPPPSPPRESTPIPTPSPSPPPKPPSPPPLIQKPPALPPADKTKTKKKKVATRRISPPRMKKTPPKAVRKLKPVQVKEPPVKEVSPVPQSRESSAVSRVDSASKPRLELIVKSEQPSQHPSPKKSKQKKERWRAEFKPKKKEDTPPETPPPKRPEGKKRSDWIFGDEDFSTPMPDDNASDKELGPPICGFAENCTIPGCTCHDLIKRANMLPAVPVTPEASTGDKKASANTGTRTIPDWIKKRYGPKKRDTSLADELERQRLAEERRARAQAMLDKLRGKTIETAEDEVDFEASIDDYGWLTKYCILPKGLEAAYKRTFDAIDVEGKGWLSAVDTMVALRASNTLLTDTQEEYIYRILQLAGYSITAGADFKLFSILAALSQRITAVDDWIKGLMDSIDFQLLEMKLFMCKSLWECNVDPETNKISLDQLCVELRAGGVSLQHEMEVRDRLSHLKALDLFDFLTYIPLFIMLHESIVENPLGDDRNK